MTEAVMIPAEKRGPKPSWRLAWMLPAGFSLILGLDAALIMLGLPAPVTTIRLPQTHGMLLVLGFVGTLIALERATALKRWYGYIVPGLLGIGGVLIQTDALPIGIGQWVLVAGAASFTALYIPLWRRRYDAQLLVQMLAAGFTLVAAILWLSGVSMDRLLPWLFAFVVLTIAAERVELATITMGPHAGGRLLVHTWSIAIALIVGLATPHVGAILLGLAFLALTAWLVRHDIARHTVRSTGAVRYMAACMLGAYAWLGVAGVLLLFGFPTQQPVYDAITHAIFLGFTMSMIMAHATTILPAVLRITLPYRPIFWIPVVLLHLSLVVRFWLGSALGIREAWVVGGTLGIIALIVFIFTALGSAIAGPPRKRGLANTDSDPTPTAQPHVGEGTHLA